MGIDESWGGPWRDLECALLTYDHWSAAVEDKEKRRELEKKGKKIKCVGQIYDFPASILNYVNQ